jgi:hypothetical protein
MTLGSSMTPRLGSYLVLGKALAKNQKLLLFINPN